MEIISVNTRRGGFSRADLLAVIVVAAGLAGWFALVHTGERSRIAACASNLRILGHAMHSDADDHHNELVPASVEVGKTSASWDMELFPYLHPDLARSTAADGRGRILLASAPRFHCPSDTLNRGANPRSYAMAARDMTMGWPPTTEDQTGLGLIWIPRTIVAALGESALEPAKAHPETLPRLKQSVITAPSDTLLLTELILPENRIGSTGAVRVFSPREQRILPFIQNIKGHSVELHGYAVKPEDVFGDDPRSFHLGKFNYLMADGHVELLTALQTGGTGFPAAGIWTLKAGD